MECFHVGVQSFTFSVLKTERATDEPMLTEVISKIQKMLAGTKKSIKTEKTADLKKSRILSISENSGEKEDDKVDERACLSGSTGESNPTIFYYLKKSSKSKSLKTFTKNDYIQTKLTKDFTLVPDIASNLICLVNNDSEFLKWKKFENQSKSRIEEERSNLDSSMCLELTEKGSMETSKNKIHSEKKIFRKKGSGRPFILEARLISPNEPPGLGMGAGFSRVRGSQQFLSEKVVNKHRPLFLAKKLTRGKKGDLEGSLSVLAEIEEGRSRDVVEGGGSVKEGSGLGEDEDLGVESGCGFQGLEGGFKSQKFVKKVEKRRRKWTEEGIVLVDIKTPKKTQNL